ncbi:MAG: hypothetical protein AAGB12_02685 [Pseudomonadota bacterium]
MTGINSNEPSLQELSSSKDVLMLNAPNAQGISFNRFSTFIIDRPIDLINLVSESAAFAADVIVIQAPTIQLKDTLTLVGPKADIIFIGTGLGSAVTCQPCRIENSFRLVMAAAQAVSLSSSGALNPIVSRPGSHITYTDLAAPGAMAVELLADNFSLSSAAKIDTHSRAQRHSNGGYVADDNGSLTMGGGAVNIYIGGLTWNFVDQQLSNLVDAYQPTSMRTINGSILSTSVNIVSAYALNNRAAINTRSNLVSSFRYQNQVVVNNEGIQLTTLFKDSYHLTLEGNIVSNGQLALNTVGELHVGRAGGRVPYIETGAIVGYAKKAITNRAEIVADTIQLAGETLTNTGPLQGLSRIELFADNSIMNHNEIMADTVVIEADNGTFLNGSRGDLGSDFLSITTSYFTDSNPSQRGLAFHPTFNHVASISSVKQTSSVIATNLSIKAKSVENINPYFAKDSSGDGEIDLDAEYFSQVRLVGEDNFLVVADSYIVNASGVMEQSAPNGRFEMQAKHFINDRYMIYNGLERVTEFSTNNSVSVSSNTIASKTFVYSPPGRVVAFGHLYIGGEYGIVNHSSYIEAYGSADFYTLSLLNDVGILHQELTKTRGVSDIILGCNSFLPNGELSMNCGSYFSNFNLGSVTSQDTQSLDSLFYVQGTTNGKEASFKAITLLPYEYHQLRALDAKKNEIFNGLFDRDAVSTNKTHMIQGRNVTLAATQTVRVPVYAVNTDCVESYESRGYRYRDIVDQRLCHEELSSYNETKPVGEPVTLDLFDVIDAYYQTQSTSHQNVMQRVK